MPDFPLSAQILRVGDHSRDSAGMRYVYPVVSRRAGGVSIGVNLNPNNACNWGCVYCQVPNLQRGGPPPIELDRLGWELQAMLDDIVAGDFLARCVPESQRRLIDIAFSGNGEPTSSAQFPQVVELVVAALGRWKLLQEVKLRLITNGSLLDRRTTQIGIERIGAVDGEVWFKVDRADARVISQINGVRLNLKTVERRLRLCGSLCSTWVQTCLFAMDNRLPAWQEVDAYLEFVGRCADAIRGVHLYGLARPSAQPDALRLSAAPSEWLEDVAARLREKGLTVFVSP
jgi:wyosine [tRNA(Phe)-imidazoG37] synthetase (radical SAM superfamily)